MSNAQKTPLARSLNRFAESKWNEAFQRVGKALPCSVVAVTGAIITVKFEVTSKFTLPQVTVPMYGAEYIRYPIKTGDKGVVFPADARLSGVSGIGGGVADLSEPGNLTALVFAPISNLEWTEVDPDAVTLYGPNGVALRDTDSASTVTLTPSGIAMEAPLITMNSSGDVTMTAAATATVSGDTTDINGTTINIAGSHVNITGVLTINGTPYLAHHHGLVQTGTGVSGGVV